MISISRRVERRLWASIVLVLLAVGAASAVNVTLALSNQNVDDGTWLWNVEDPGHTRWATGTLFMQHLMTDVVFPEIRNRKLAARAKIVGGPTGYICTQLWSGLSTAQKNAACTQNSEPNGCDMCETQ